MKIKPILILVLILTSLLSYSQELKPFKNEKGKWGLKNEKNKTIVKPKFDNILKQAAYKEVDGNPITVYYYIVNNGGKIHSKMIYDTIITTFLNDETGDEDIEERHIEMECQYITGGKFGLLGSDGNTVLEIIYDSLDIPYNSYNHEIDNRITYYVNISLASDMIKHEGSDNIEFNTFHPIFVSKDNKWGLMSFEGKQLVEIRYDSIGEFGYEFYNNNILCVVTDWSGKILFKADDEIVKTSNAYLKWDMYGKDYESNDFIENSLVIYLTNSSIDTITVTDTILIMNEETWYEEEELYYRKVPIIKAAKLRLVNSNGKE